MRTAQRDRAGLCHGYDAFFEINDYALQLETTWGVLVSSRRSTNDSTTLDASSADDTLAQ